MTAPSQYVLQVERGLFTPANAEPWERALDYMIGYISDNAKLARFLDAASRSQDALDAALSQISKGQAMLYALSIFQMEVNNGGVSQFFINADQLKRHIAPALTLIGCHDEADHYLAILARREAHHAALQSIWNGGAGAGPDADKRFAQCLNPEAKQFEDAFFPAYAEKTPIVGVYAARIGSGIVGYVESHRDEFQSAGTS